MCFKAFISLPAWLERHDFGESDTVSAESEFFVIVNSLNSYLVFIFASPMRPNINY